MANKYYLYNNISGTHPSWTLAVLATSQRDADAYVRAYNGGGKRAGVVEPGGTVRADCGSVIHDAALSLATVSVETV